MRIGGLLARHYGEQAKQELSADGRRLITGAVLLLVAVLMLSHVLLLAHGVAIFALIEQGVAPLTALAALLGADLLGAVVLGGVGYGRLKRPLMVKTRSSISEVAAVLVKD